MPSAPPPVTSDFYDLEALLDDDDRALLHRVRAFMDTEVQPIINEYWTKAQFPRQLIPGLAELGIAGTPYSGYGCPGKSTLLDGMIAMELSRGDPSVSTFMGVHGGLAMGTHPPLRLRGAEGTLAARDGPHGAHRRLRPDRAGLRFRRRPRPADDGPPGRRLLGAQRPEEVDRQRQLRRPGDHLGPGRGDRPGARLRRRAGHRGLLRRRPRGQDRAARGAERAHHARRTSGCPRRTGCRRPTASGTPPRC